MILCRQQPQLHWGRNVLEDLKAGEVVRLKSGGPAMTILEKQGPHTADCAWFAEVEVRTASFPVVALEVVHLDFDPDAYPK
jgi:uncharacterized protein YodC (DUF2158 family)